VQAGAAADNRIQAEVLAMDATPERATAARLRVQVLALALGLAAVAVLALAFDRIVTRGARKASGGTGRAPATVPAAPTPRVPDEAPAAEHDPAEEIQARVAAALRTGVYSPVPRPNGAAAGTGDLRIDVSTLPARTAKGVEPSNGN